MNTGEKLVGQANQIAAFFAPQGEARAVPAIADHIKKFWDPGMRNTFLTLQPQAHEKLHPLARKAIQLIR